MQKTTNAAGFTTPAASQKSSKHQDYTINPDKSKGQIHRNPIRLQRSPNQLPSALKRLHQWCLSGHDKTPLDKHGYKMDVTNPSNYLSFDEATATSAKLTCAAGVGFILTGTNIVVVDIDHCYQNGKFSQLAMELMGLLPTYTELSQSKTGLHFIYLDNQIPPDFSGRKGVVEIYADKRYIALTGWKITDFTADLAVLNGMTKRLLNTYSPNTGYNSSADFQTVLEQHSYPPVQSDDAVLQSLQSNQKFQRLYSGNISGYPSQSEADGALMLILATATALNADQMRRLFSQSALGKRDKWCNRVWYQDYLITGAIKFAESKGDDDEMNKTNKTPSNQFILQSDYLANHYYQDAAIIRGYSHRNTGFKSLNKVQPLPPSLLVIGAEPGTGKTTFCYQLAEQLVQNNDNEFAIYVSYEMSQLELFTKSLTRRTKLANFTTKPSDKGKDYPLDGFAAQQGKIPHTTKQIIEELQQHPLNFGVYEATSKDTVDTLLSTLEDIVSSAQSTNPSLKSPIVVLDYLQIVPHNKDNNKLGVDNIVLKLKEFQRKTKATFIVISSINRGSYAGQPTLAAFKESGSIEFTADIAWILVRNKSHMKEFPDAPSKVILYCLKNRFGATGYQINLDFYAAENLFLDAQEKNPGHYKDVCVEG